MANNQELKQFVVWAPDHTDADAPARRRSVQPPHLERIRKLIKEGVIRSGGGVLTPESVNAAPGDEKYFGSCVVIEAENLEAVRKIIEGDLYYSAGVWDKEKLHILPIQLAVPLPPVPS